MSEGYGFFRIGVYKKDGSPDEAKAKEVFAWLKANCEWFNNHWYESVSPRAYKKKADVFVLEGNEISNNSAEAPDGLDVDEDDEDPFGRHVPGNLDFLCKASAETKAETIVASFLFDGSESYWGNTSYLEKVWIDGVKKDGYSREGFRFMDPLLDEESFRSLCGVFRNTKTGEECLAGQLMSKLDGEVVPDDEVFEGDFDDLEQFLWFNYADEYVSPDDKEACVKAFVAEFKEKFGEDAQISETDWTFERLGTKRTLFDLYGTNPPLKQYRWASDVIAEMNKK